MFKEHVNATLMPQLIQEFTGSGRKVKITFFDQVSWEDFDRKRGGHY